MQDKNKANAVLDISAYKTSLIELLISSDNIIKLIDSQQAGVYEPADHIYKNIFPYLHVNGTQTDEDSYILIAVSQPQLNRRNGTFTDIHVQIQVVVHRQRMELDNANATRLDAIAHEIIGILDGGVDFGFGMLECYSSIEDMLTDVYLRRELYFRTVDLTKYSNDRVGILGKNGWDRR